VSLKAFHIFFLIIAILFDLGMLAYACFGENSVARELQSYGIGLGIIAGVLIVYTVWFIRKKAPKIIV
jgi:cytosine/uracil/thiamine/allantoin permease